MMHLDSSPTRRSASLDALLPVLVRDHLLVSPVFVRDGGGLRAQPSIFRSEWYDIHTWRRVPRARTVCRGG